ncbi:hypothetical protein [Actinoplanes sp. NPDC051494]|uniref:hypothetical protein n=1 Tax=Actinoplanes sp. NPDC051494 TaxID=3363907 RepID=UPI0037B874BC
MSSSDGLWKLHLFPPRVECPVDVAGEVQHAYERWKESRKINPERDAKAMDGGDRHTAVVHGARYVDENFVEHQLMCDYEIRPGLWGEPGTVVFVEYGFVGSLD